MAGTINLAFTQQFDMDGAPLSGGLLYFFTAGTTTPQSAFQDTGLTIVHPNPIVLDSSGRVPMFYLADGFIKIRLTDKNGVTIIAADQLLVIGPSSGGGGGGGSSPGDVTQLMSTGDIKARYSTIVVDGFVRLNGLTIGNTGSSATERADPACLPLFTYLWPFTNITLDGFAKGADALTDWGNGRRMILPDLRGRTIAGMDDMGATAANRLTSTYFGASGIVLGNVGGAENVTLGAGNLPVHAHSLSGSFGGSGTTDSQGSHSHAGGSLATNATVSGTTAVAVAGGSASAGVTSGASFSVYPVTSFNVANVGAPWSGATDIAGAHAHNVSVSTALSGSTGNGSGTLLSTPTRTVQPAMLLTWYMKL